MNVISDAHIKICITGVEYLAIIHQFVSLIVTIKAKSMQIS